MQEHFMFKNNDSVKAAMIYVATTAATIYRAVTRKAPVRINGFKKMSDLIIEIVMEVKEC
jgi:hypothetical protein